MAVRVGTPYYTPSGRDLPPEYGHWNTTAHRFGRRQKNGQWAQLLVALSDDPDFEWLIIDASYVKMHQHGTGAVGGNQPIGRTKGG